MQLTRPIRNIRIATPRARIVRVDLQGTPFAFAPGQAIWIGAHGQDVRKPYSIASAPGRTIRAQDIEFLHALAPVHTSTSDRLPSLAEAERVHIMRVLEAVRWNKKEAARVLDISRGTLYRKIAEYGLEPGVSASAPEVSAE